MRVLLCTIGAGDGPGFVRGLVEDRLIACGNIVASVRSVYRWQGAVHDDPEDLIVMETRSDDIDATIAAIQERHPYDVPKILAIAPDAVLPAYASWVMAQTAPSRPSGSNAE